MATLQICRGEQVLFLYNVYVAGKRKHPDKNTFKFGKKIGVLFILKAPIYQKLKSIFVLADDIYVKEANYTGYKKKTIARYGKTRKEQTSDVNRPRSVCFRFGYRCLMWCYGIQWNQNVAWFWKKTVNNKFNWRYKSCYSSVFLSLL